MPLREGSLTSLIKNHQIHNYGSLCQAVLKQMLSALDYLANESPVHRDWKPDNILYYGGGGVRSRGDRIGNDPLRPV